MLGGGWANVHNEGRLAPGLTTWVRSPTPETQRHAQYRHQLIANQPAQRLWNQIIYGYFWFTWNHGDIISITLTNLFRKIAQLLSNGLSDRQVKLSLRISQGKISEEPMRQFPNNHVSKFIKCHFPPALSYSALLPSPIKLRSGPSDRGISRPLIGQLWLNVSLWLVSDSHTWVSWQRGDDTQFQLCLINQKPDNFRAV